MNLDRFVVERDLLADDLIDIYLLRCKDHFVRLVDVTNWKA